MKNKKQMCLKDAQTLVKVAHYLDEMNKLYGYPYGKNPIGVIMYAINQIKQGKEE